MLVKQNFLVQIILSFCSLLALKANGQDPVQGSIYTRIDGSYLMSATIQPNGDTAIEVMMHEIEIRAPRTFVNPDEYKRWEKYKYYAPPL